MEFEKTITTLNKKWGWINRLAGLIAAGLLAAYSVLSFSSLTGMAINQAVLLFYYLGFACLIIGAEFKYDAVLNNFAFLGNFFGKGVFISAIGLSMFGSDAGTVRVALAIVLVIVGALFIGLFFIPRRITDSEPDKYKTDAPAAPAGGAARA